MSYNFDNQIDRQGTSSVKFDLRKTFFDKDDVLPMWVADMDFETPDFIREAIFERAKHPIYGYTFRDDTYYQQIIDWFKRRHNWQIQKDWIVFSPGIVPALNLVVLALTQPKDEIIVQPPVYFPFFGAATEHDRGLIYNQLIKSDSTYTIDFDLLEQQAKSARMLLLCNPHNPVGRAWKRDELERLAEICLKHDLLVLSDEIHADLVLPGYRHHVFADLSPEIAAKTITAHAPSKTFNLAGLATSSLIISDEVLRKKVTGIYDKMHVGHGNLFGITASNAAFEHGDKWLDEMLDYVDNNIQYAVGFLQEKMPKIKVYVPEATYMVWLDFAAYGMDDAELKRCMIEEAGLGLSPGSMFGPGGDGFMRINLACPLATVRLAMEKLYAVFSEL
jgi:cysteine-S-conjugate beta-lyase